MDLDLTAVGSTVRDSVGTTVAAAVPVVRDVITGTVVPVAREGIATAVPAVREAFSGTVLPAAVEAKRIVTPHVVNAGRYARSKGADLAAAAVATEAGQEMLRRASGVAAAAGGQLPAPRWRSSAAAFAAGMAVGAMAASVLRRPRVPVAAFPDPVLPAPGGSGPLGATGGSAFGAASGSGASAGFGAPATEESPGAPPAGNDRPS